MSSDLINPGNSNNRLRSLATHPSIMQEQDFINVKKFSGEQGSSFLLWQRRTAGTLAIKDLVDVIKPSSPGTRVEAEREQKAMAYLERSISDEVLNKFMHCETAFELWNALSKKYAMVDEEQVIQLKSQLSSINLLQFDSVSAYINALNEKIHELQAAGHSYSELEQFHLGVQGLPYEKYSSFVQSIGGLPAASRNLAALETKLQYLESLEKKSGKQEKQKEEQALKAREKKFQQYGDKKKTCFRCDEVGHMKAQCPYKLVKNGGITPQKETANRAEEEQGHGFALMSGHTRNASEWIVDGGASSSMTWDRSAFGDDFQSIKPIPIYGNVF